MPEICRFYGIVIRMFFDDHSPSHFHAIYGAEDVAIEIQSLAVFAGHLSPRALSLVIEWAASHQDELMQMWQRCSDHQPLGRIDPLK